ncbi:MAG: hypothetical protein WKG07_29625 [Hymenobacter sp.]
MPAHSVEGLLGHFAPALPLHRHEIEQRLGWFDYGRLCEPYIRWHMLEAIFGERSAGRLRGVLRRRRLRHHTASRPAVGTQRELEAYVAEKLRVKSEELKAGVRPVNF